MSWLRGVSWSWRGLSTRFTSLLHLDDPPWRIALALAVGVFIGCTPFYGLQTLLALGVATVARLNKAATITGAWLNLPWLTPFVYAAALKVGTLVVPDPDGSRSAWVSFMLTHPGGLSWHDILTVLEEVSGALLVGTTLVGAAAAVLTYAVAVTLISWRRARRAQHVAGGRSDSRAA